jgi:phage gp36-like protein
MMAYITLAELKDFITERELIELTDDENTGVLGAVAQARVTAAIEAASADIDSYARGRYATPLQTSTKVKQLARALAIWYLEQRRRAIREDTQKGYEAAMAFLKDLAAGRAQVDQPTGATAQSDAQQVRTTEKLGTFSDDNLDKF